MTRKQYIAFAVVILVAVAVSVFLSYLYLYFMTGGRMTGDPPAPYGVVAEPARARWVTRGSGDMVFDMPSSVRRVKVTGHYATGNAQNFAVKINHRLVVNVILGTSGTDGVDFQGTYATRGGQVEVVGSNGVSWVFEEVR